MAFQEFFGNFYDKVVRAMDWLLLWLSKLDMTAVWARATAMAMIAGDGQRLARFNPLAQLAIGQSRRQCTRTGRMYRS